MPRKKIKPQTTSPEIIKQIKEKILISYCQKPLGIIIYTRKGKHLLGK